MKRIEALISNRARHRPAWARSPVVALMGIVLALAFIAAAAAFLWWDRQERIESQLDEAEMLAMSLNGESTRAIATTQTLVNALADDLIRHDLDDTAHVNLLLSQMIGGAPFIRSISLVGPASDILFSSNPRNLGQRVDPDRLPQPNRQASPRGLTIGVPLHGRDLADVPAAKASSSGDGPAGLYFVPVSRRITLRAGYEALIVVALNADALASGYALMHDTPRTATLLRYDGVVLFSVGAGKLPLGENLASRADYRARLPLREHDKYVGPDFSGEPSVVAYRASRVLPLVTVVDVDLSDALAPWVALARWTCAAVFASLLIWAAVCTAAWRSLRENERVNRVFDDLIREIARQERRRSAILESAMDGIVTLNEQGRILELNASACRIFGCDNETIVGQPALEALIAPASRGRLAATEPASADTPARQRLELGALRAGGEVFPAEISTLEVALQDARLQVWTVRDLSDAKRAAKARSRLLEKYRDSSSDLRGLKHALDQHAIVGIFDPEGVIVYANKRMAATSGYPREDLIGQSCQLLQPEDGGDARRSDLLPLIQAAKAWSGQLVQRKRDGSLYWTASTLVPVFGSDNAFKHVFLIQTDITAQITAERAVDAARQAELALGAGIQRGLLMRPLPADLRDCLLAGFNVAAQGVNGDFFDLFEFNDHCFDILVGDAMGKGVPAALLGAGVKMQFNRSLAELQSRPDGGDGPPSPASILTHVQHAVHPRLERLESFVTVCYLRIDLKRRLLTWVGCGHEETLLLRPDGQSVLLQNQHPPLGTLEEAQLIEQSMPLSERDTLVLYSDGLTDAIDRDGQRYGVARLRATLEDMLRTHRRPGTLVRGMRQAMKRHVDHGSVSDDMTLMVLQFPTPGEHQWRYDMPPSLGALTDLRAFVGRAAQAAELDEAASAALALAAVELASNVIRHGAMPRPAPLEVVAIAAPGVCRLEMMHEGIPFQPPDRLTPDFSGRSQGGFGLYIIRESCDEVIYEHASGVNRAILIKRNA